MANHTDDRRRALHGRRALVTGGSRGIGRAIAVGLAADGADVAISYRRDESLAASCGEAIRGAGVQAAWFGADLTRAEQVEGLAERVLAEFGPIDILVHNAGIGFRGAPVANTSRDEVVEALQINAIAAHQLCRALLPSLRARERSDVVVLSSVVASVLGADHAPYAMSKVALEAFAMVLAKEERANGVRVNVVAPGLVATEMGQGYLRKLGVHDFAEISSGLPFGRVCEADDVANVVRFLVSDGASYMTGQRVVVDGGGGTERPQPPRPAEVTGPDAPAVVGIAAPTPTDLVAGGFERALDGLHEAAAAATGLDDFGDDDYLVPLLVLLQAYDTDSRLTPAGRGMIGDMLMRILRNRLRVVHDWQTIPGVLGLGITKPIFILGLPRTGTTALHHLLALDPRHQVLQNWVGNAPQPRPAPSAWATNPDYQQAVAELDALYAPDPSLKAMHFVTADGPDECRLLFLQTFVDDTLDSNATVPSYHQWRLGLDMAPVYRWHRDQLKLIGSNEPTKRWVLKDPPHMRWIDTLMETYPDACIIQTHRDPGKVVPSLCSLVSGFRVALEGPRRGDEDYDWLVEHYLAGVTETMRYRAGTDGTQFYDVQFNDLVARPIEIVEAVYDHFGMDLDGPTADRMRQWHGANTKGEHGEHVYRAESFGLTPEAVRERFSDYIATYSVPSET